MSRIYQNIIPKWNRNAEIIDILIINIEHSLHVANNHIVFDN